MSDKFANKYRITSARLNNWDYSKEAIYFITICTKGRESLFGSVSNGRMNYSDIGRIVLEEWEKSFLIRSELFCDAFVIMPNHLHAILRIENDDKIAVETHGRASVSSFQSMPVETHGRASQTLSQSMPPETHGRASQTLSQSMSPETHGRASLPPPNSGIAFRAKKSISSFMAGFKSSATKRVNQYRQMPGMILWQERFHDHIIRNDGEYQRILEYIETNPAHWGSDIHNIS